MPSQRYKSMKSPLRDPKILEPDVLYTSQEVAQYMKISPATVRQWMPFGRLSPRIYRYMGRDVLNYIATSQSKQDRGCRPLGGQILRENLPTYSTKENVVR